MRNRSVIEIMVICFTGVVAFSILATGGLIAVVEIRDPTADTETLANGLLALIASILGALLGLLAGKASATNGLSQRPDGSLPPSWGSQTDELDRRPEPPSTEEYEEGWVE